MSTIRYLMVTFILLSTTVKAEITPLLIDKSQFKTKVNIKVKTQDIKSAHDVISHNLSATQVKFAILNTGLNSNDIKWLLEKAESNFFILRRDTSAGTIFTKVEFDKQYIQLKYFGSSDDYNCKHNVNGICYKNRTRSYYRHMKELRQNIIKTLPKKES